MSTLMQLSNEVLAANPAVAIPMAEGDGILDLISSKNTQPQTVLRGVAVTLGIIFLIIFAYMPIYGLSVAFMRYRTFDTFQTAPWVGFENFRIAFTDRFFWDSVAFS